jgi:stage V sporulation protein SpoVS
MSLFQRQTEYLLAKSAACAAAPSGGVRRYGLPRNAAHDVDAELQAEGVNVVGQRLEAFAIRRRREAVDGRDQAAVLVHVEMRLGIVPEGARVGLRPLDIHDDVLPAVLEQALRHVVGVGFDLGLGHRGAVAVPTVPAHRRAAGKRWQAEWRLVVWCILFDS